MAKKQKLTKEQKKMSHARAVSGGGSRTDPYYPTDYNVGKRNPKREEKPMIEKAKIMTTKEWVGTLIVLMIPIVNIIALIAWMNKKNEKINPGKRTFAKAYLIVWAISLVVAIVLAVAIVALSLFMFPFPSSITEAGEMLEEAGYEVTILEGDDAKLITLNDNVEGYLYAELEEGDDYVEMIYFIDNESAEAYMEELESAEEGDEMLIIGIKDDVVYVGTEDAVGAINGDSLI